MGFGLGAGARPFVSLADRLADKAKLPFGPPKPRASDVAHVVASTAYDAPVRRTRDFGRGNLDAADSGYHAPLQLPERTPVIGRYGLDQLDQPEQPQHRIAFDRLDTAPQFDLTNGQPLPSLAAQRFAGGILNSGIPSVTPPGAPQYGGQALEQLYNTAGLPYPVGATAPAPDPYAEELLGAPPQRFLGLATGLDPAGEFTGRYGGIAGRWLGGELGRPRRTSLMVAPIGYGERSKRGEAIGGAVGGFAGGSLPIAAAYAIAPMVGLAPAVLGAYFVAYGSADVLSAFTRYKAGKIDERELVSELAMTAPNFLPVIAHGAGKVVEAVRSGKAGAALRTVEGELVKSRPGERGALELGAPDELPPADPNAPLPGQPSLFDEVAPAEQPRMAVPEQKPGGDVPLAERQALSLESPAPKGGGLFDVVPPHEAPSAVDSLPPAELAAPAEGARPAAPSAGSSLAAETGLPVVRVPINDLEFRPDLFQARDVADGKPYNPAQIERLRRLQESGVTIGPPTVVRNPETGKYIVTVGHNRTQLAREGGATHIDVKVDPADIKNPADLSRMQDTAIQSNYKTGTSFSEDARAYSMLQARGHDATTIRDMTKGGSVGKIEDALDAARLGSQALERMNADKGAQGIGSEIGRGMRAYGITTEDANAMFNRFLTPDERGNVPSRTAVRAAVDLVGKQLQSGNAVQFEGFAGMGAGDGGAMKLLNEFVQKKQQLEGELREAKVLQKKLDRVEKDPSATAKEKRNARNSIDDAAARQARLEREVGALQRGVTREMKATPARNETAASKRVTAKLDEAIAARRSGAAPPYELKGLTPAQLKAAKAGDVGAMDTVRGLLGAARQDLPGRLTRWDTPELIAARARQEAELAKGLHVTRDKTTGALENVTPERRQFLNGLVDDELARTEQSIHLGKPSEVSVPIRQEHEAYIVLGPPAAGKSSVIVDGLVTDHGARIIDSDEWKGAVVQHYGLTKNIEEGGDGYPGVAHDASDLVWEGVLDRSIETGDNLALPLVGRNAAKIDQLGQRLKDAGYRVHLVDVMLPADTAAGRTSGRFTEAGRLVDPDYVNKIGDAPERTYATLKGKDWVDEHQQVNNDVPFGSPPEVVTEPATSAAGDAGRPGPGHPVPELVQQPVSPTRPPADERGAAGSGERDAAAPVEPPSDRGAQQPPLEPPAPPKEPPAGGASDLPSAGFPDLTARYTTEQRDIFDRINADAETQARVKGFGSVKRAIEAGQDAAAPLLAKAKATTRRLLSPLYYVRNANVLQDEQLGIQRLAHARKLAVSAQDAQAIAIRVGERGDAVGAFRSIDEWKRQYIGPTATSKAQVQIIGFIGDVIERPSLYRMPSRTREFLVANQKFLLSRLRYAKASGVNIQEFNGDFVTHIYKSIDETPASSIKGGVGAKQATQKSRLFGSYWDAAGRKGFEPEFLPKPGEGQRGAFEMLTRTHQAQLGKAIADADLVKAIEQDKGNLRRTSPTRGYRETTVPGLRGSYFKNDIAEMIDDALGRQGQSTLERIMLIPSDMAKTTMATLDASPLIGIQGVRRIVDNPLSGLRDIVKATQLVVDDGAWKSWLIANEDVMRQGAADGLNLFQDFKVSTEGGGQSLIAHIPGIGKLETAANDRFYGRGVAMYKALSYAENKAQIEWALSGGAETKALNPLNPLSAPYTAMRGARALSSKVRAALARGETPGQVAAQHVNNMYGGLESALRGQSRGYQSFERFMMFAPDFMRAQMGLITTAAGKALTPQGAASLRFLLGSLAVTAGVSELFTQAASDGRQHANFAHPELGDWLTIKTPAGNISFMGPLRTYLRTIYTTGLAGKHHDFEKVLGNVEFFAKTRMGPVPSGALAQATNRDVLGRPVSTATPNSLGDIVQRGLFAGKSVLPFGAQQVIETLQKGGAQPLGIAAISAAGFSVFPERIRTSLNEVAQQHFGRDYNALSPGEKAQLATNPTIIRAQHELDAESQAKADAGDPVALVLQFEHAASDKYRQSLQQIESLPPGQDWRDQYKAAREARLAALDTLQKVDARPVQEFFARLNAREPGSPRLQVLNDYFNIFEKYKNQTTGQIDAAQKDAFNTALDEFQAGLAPDQSEQLQQDLGAKDTPRQAEYRADVKLIADSGYFDVARTAYQSPGWQGLLNKQFGGEAGKVPALADLKAAYVAYWVPRLVKEQGRDPQVAEADAGRAFDAFPVVAQFNDALTAARTGIFTARPDVLRAATKWGYNTLSEDEERILQGAR